MQTNKLQTSYSSLFSPKWNFIFEHTTHVHNTFWSIYPEPATSCRCCQLCLSPQILFSCLYLFVFCGGPPNLTRAISVVMELVDREAETKTGSPPEFISSQWCRRKDYGPASPSPVDSWRLTSPVLSRLGADSRQHQLLWDDDDQSVRSGMETHSPVRGICFYTYKISYLNGWW